jgi:A/G-specific adenine glycosylase
VVARGAAQREVADGVWVAIDRLGDYALPKLMKKVVEHALRCGIPPPSGRGLG